MMNDITHNSAITQCAEVAGYLWQKGWAERNGGNMLVRLAETEVRTLLQNDVSLSPPITIGLTLPHLRGSVFYCKGTGCRMRDLARSPLQNGCLIRVSDDGAHYMVIGATKVRPTSELPSHLALHDALLAAGSTYTATLHTHPTTLVAMTHVEDLVHSDLTALLWSQLPEARLFCPKGLAVVPYAEPGSTALAQGTLKALSSHDMALWERHGAVSVGENIIEAFDTIDVMEKAALIYLRSRMLKRQ